nr:MAG TPA: hypothetical protein [Caudoviricetes sp.]
MDFFDSAFDSIHGQSVVNDDEFTSFESFLDTDDDYMTESVVGAAAIAAWGVLMAGAVAYTTIHLAKTLDIFKDLCLAIKNYQKANPAVTPLLKLKHKRFRLSGFNNEQKKEVNDVLKHVDFPGNYLDAYYDRNGKEVVAFVFNKKESVGYDSTLVVKKLTAVRGKNLSEDEFQYYTCAFMLRHWMWSQSSKLEGWAKKWASVNKDEKTKTESFEENDLSLAEEFFPESAVDTIMAPLSKFRAKIATWNKDKYVEKAKRTTGTDNKEVVPYWDPKNIEASFSEYMKDVNSKIIPKLKDHADRKEIVEICNAANADYTRRIKETKAKDRGRYTRDALRKECKRCSDYVVSSATKISNAIEAASKGSSDPNFARACAYAVTKTSAICSDALSAIGVNDDLYDADVMARRAQASGIATGASAGYVAGSH